MNDERRTEEPVVNSQAENKAETIDNQVNNKKMEGVDTPQYVKQEDFQAFMKDFLNKLLSVKEEPKEVKVEEPTEPTRKTYEDYTKW